MTVPFPYKVLQECGCERPDLEGSMRPWVGTDRREQGMGSEQGPPADHESTQCF